MRIISRAFPVRTMASEEDSPIEVKNVIGPRVRQARVAMEPPVSQEDFSGRLARKGITMTQASISKLENRERAVLDYEAQALAKILKVGIAWLYSED